MEMMQAMADFADVGLALIFLTLGVAIRKAAREEKEALRATDPRSLESRVPSTTPKLSADTASDQASVWSWESAEPIETAQASQGLAKVD